jgi:hypothetical protein
VTYDAGRVTDEQFRQAIAQAGYTLRAERSHVVVRVHRTALFSLARLPEPGGAGNGQP